MKLLVIWDHIADYSPESELYFLLFYIVQQVNFIIKHLLFLDDLRCNGRHVRFGVNHNMAHIGIDHEKNIRSCEVCKHLLQVYSPSNRAYWCLCTENIQKISIKFEFIRYTTVCMRYKERAITCTSWECMLIDIKHLYGRHHSKLRVLENRIQTLPDSSIIKTSCN